jgi:hypothetical protein
MDYPKTGKINLSGLECHSRFLLWKNIILAMFNPDPFKRPTAAQCVMHEVFMEVEDLDLFQNAITDAMRQRSDAEVEAVFHAYSAAVAGPEMDWSKTQHPKSKEPLDPNILNTILKLSRYDTSKAIDLQRLIRNLRVHYPQGSGATSPGHIESPELTYFMELYPRLFPLLFHVAFRFFPHLEVLNRRFKGDNYWIQDGLSNIDLLEGVALIDPTTLPAASDSPAEIPEETIRKLREELKEQKKVNKEQADAISRLEAKMKGMEEGIGKMKASQDEIKAKIRPLKEVLDKKEEENEILTDDIQEKEIENKILMDENASLKELLEAKEKKIQEI